MTKISDLTALTGAGVDTAVDLLPIVDMSAAGAARNKKITVAEAKIALAVPAAITELDDVPDVNAPAPTNGDVLTWDSTPGEWVSTAPVTGSTTLDGLTDVNTPAPGNGEVLTWDSTPGEWVSQALPGAGAFVLDDATDCDTTGQSTGDVLTYDGADWVPQAPSGSGDFTFIGRTVVTTLSAVDIPLSASYGSFHVEFYFTASNDNIGLNAAVSDDNFSTVEAGATDYYYTRLAASGTATGVVSSNGTTVVSVLGTSSIGNAANEYTEGTIEVVNAKETSPTHLRFDLSWISGSTVFGSTTCRASFKLTNVIDGLRITPTAGTLTGFYKLWGRSV